MKWQLLLNTIKNKICIPQHVPDTRSQGAQRARQPSSLVSSTQYAVVSIYTDSVHDRDEVFLILFFVFFGIKLACFIN